MKILKKISWFELQASYFILIIFGALVLISGLYKTLSSIIYDPASGIGYLFVIGLVVYFIFYVPFVILSEAKRKFK